MAEGDLITLDAQLEIRGLLLGKDTNFGLLRLSGLDMPALRTSDHPRPRDHGEFGGEDYLGKRIVELELIVKGATAQAIQDNLDTLANAWEPSNSDIPLVVRWATYKRRVNGRPRRRAWALDRKARFSYARAVLGFECPDPRIYDAALSSGSAGLGSVSGGLAFPHGFPHGFGSASPGSIVANNAGNFPTRPVARINGPVTNPKLENVTADKHMQFTITIASGDYLLVDLADRTILLNGTASRYSTLSAASRWWELAPGNNQINFSGTSAGSPTLQLEWRGAWN